MADAGADANEEPDVDPTASPDQPEPDAEDGDEDVDMVKTNVEETGMDPDGFFDDVETSTEGSDGEPAVFGGEDDDTEDEDGGSGVSETKTTGLAEDINNGAARLAVLGLDDEWEVDGDVREKDDLEDEFREVFEAFRLGHYGEQVVEEYLLVEADDIHPVWGLCGAIMASAALVIYRRPDGDQIIESGKTRFGNLNIPDKLDPDT